jgi:hypothetical protein
VELQLREIDLYMKIGMQAMMIELLEAEIQKRDQIIAELSEKKEDK